MSHHTKTSKVFADSREAVETEISQLSKRFTPSASIGPPQNTSSNLHQQQQQQRISISSSIASLGSLLARNLHCSHGQPTTEGRIKLKSTIDCESQVLCCKWSNDGTMFAVGMRSGEIRLFTHSGQESNSIPPPERKPGAVEEDFMPKKVQNGMDDSSRKTLAGLIFKYLLEPPVTSLIWHPEFSNIIIATYSDGQIHSWEVPERGKPTKPSKISIFRSGIDVKLASSPAILDDSLITYTKHDITLRDINTFDSVMDFKQARPPGCLLKEAGALWVVGAKGKDVIGGGHSLTWWDTRTGEVKRQIGAIHIEGHALGIHPTGNRLVTGSSGCTNESVKIWEASVGKVTHVLASESYQTNVKSTTWAGRDVIAVGGSDPHVIRLVNLENTTLGGIKGLKHGITFLDAFVARGHQPSKLLAASGNFIYLIDLPK